MDMFREQFKFNLMARDGRPLASKTTTKVPVPFVVVRSARLLLVIVLAGDIISAGSEGLHCEVFCCEKSCPYWIDCFGACDHRGWHGCCRHGVAACCGDGAGG